MMRLFWTVIENQKDGTLVWLDQEQSIALAHKDIHQRTEGGMELTCLA